MHLLHPHVAALRHDSHRVTQLPLYCCLWLQELRLTSPLTPVSVQGPETHFRYYSSILFHIIVPYRTVTTVTACSHPRWHGHEHTGELHGWLHAGYACNVFQPHVISSNGANCIWVDACRLYGSRVVQLHVNFVDAVNCVWVDACRLR